MIISKKINTKQSSERARSNVFWRFFKPVFLPFRIIYIHGMAFFLWVSFTLIGGLIGIMVSLIRNSLFGSLNFKQAMYIESHNGSFYTYSIAIVASVLSTAFIVFAENNRLQFRRYQIVTITISIFLLFFGGVFYALSIEAHPVAEMQTIKDISINWRQLSVVGVSILVAIYSFCVCRLDNHAEQFRDIMDSKNREEYANDNEKLPSDVQPNNLNTPTV